MNMRTNPVALSRSAGPYVGLTDAECFAIARSAGHLPGRWWVQHDEDDQEHASISLVPNDCGVDDGAPVFLLWRECGALQLGCGQGDLYADLGTHADVEAIMDVIRRLLEGAAVFERWIRVRDEL